MSRFVKPSPHEIELKWQGALIGIGNFPPHTSPIMADLLAVL